MQAFRQFPALYVMFICQEIALSICQHFYSCWVKNSQLRKQTIQREIFIWSLFLYVIEFSKINNHKSSNDQQFVRTMTLHLKHGEYGWLCVLPNPWAPMQTSVSISPLIETEATRKIAHKPGDRSRSYATSYPILIGCKLHAWALYGFSSLQNNLWWFKKYLNKTIRCLLASSPVYYQECCQRLLYC